MSEQKRRGHVERDELMDDERLAKARAMGEGRVKDFSGVKFDRAAMVRRILAPDGAPPTGWEELAKRHDALTETPPPDQSQSPPESPDPRGVKG